jgi:hypothetical protein
MLWSRGVEKGLLKSTIIDLIWFVKTMSDSTSRNYAASRRRVDFKHHAELLSLFTPLSVLGTGISYANSDFNC